MALKSRLDVALLDRGLVESREKAHALVLAGEVLVNGVKARKPGQSVSEGDVLDVLARPPYVSRGGLKLEAALRHWHIDPAGRVGLDIGASTGGFTDCLLQHGALRVHAVDVGAGQLDWKLRTDPRVVLHEHVNARHLTPEDIGEGVSLVVMDVSFISATRILGAAAGVLQAGGEMVILVKPQFEAGKGQVGRGGIVRDAVIHQAACDRVAEAARSLHFQTALIESPFLGTEGNKEFLLYARHEEDRNLQ